MDLSIFESFGWRDAVMVVVIVVAVYMLLTVLRLLQVRRHSPSPEAPIAKQEPLLDEPLLGDAVTLSPEFAALLPAFSRKPSPIFELIDAPPKENLQPINTDQRPEPEFVRPQPRSGVEAELQLLRDELARLSDQVAEVLEDVELLKSSRNVSPLYSEAMGLAQQGHDARSIAGRCGISIGEAELVVALSRKEQGFDVEVERANEIAHESEDDDDRASADDPRR
jgi:hypothetical protein